MGTRDVTSPLEEALDLLIQSEPFDRLLASNARPLVARAEAGQDVVIAALARAMDAPVLAVATGPHEAEALARGVGAYLGPERVVLFPAWESLPYEGISPAPEVVSRRSRAARRARAAAGSGAYVVVMPALAALQGIPADLGTHDPLVVARGDDLPPDALAERLVGLGYVRAEVVEHRGEFAVRGGTLDFFPGAGRRPVRAEYWGDEIESLREFSAATQLSTDPVDRVEADPVRELLATDEVRRRAAAAAPRHLGRYRDGLARLSEGLTFEGMEVLSGLLGGLESPASLLPWGSWAVLTPAGRVADRAARAAAEAATLAEAIGWPGPPAIRPLEEALEGRPSLHLSEFTEGLDLGLAGWGSAAGNPAELAARVAERSAAGFRVIVAAEAHGSLDRARELIEERAGAPPPGARPVETALAPVGAGFVFGPGRLAVAGEEDLFGSRRHTRQAPRIARRRADAIALELEPGDFAVHHVHGVARYGGIVHREIKGSARDFLRLEYAGGDKLYVPADQVGVVAKYLGGDQPRIHKLGAGDWPRAKARVRRAVQEMAGELARLYSVRMAVPGYAFKPDTPWQRELEDAFPFEETRDQVTAIEEVKRDMEQPVPMDRLICGDVGYGKTEIAIRAAFKAVMDGKQVAVLVPTTLLAEQHYVTFTERYTPFPVRVAMLSRFLSAAEQAEVVRDLATGKIDVVIGTHRLLGRDVKFRDLGLLVVDEEQRFGVAHKERIKQMRAHVDVLTMTATPIPRTMEMALTGVRELSVLDTPPEDRQPVLTYVGPYDDGLAYGAVRRELLRGGQVFFVHNRVQTIGRTAVELQREVPEARVIVAHGQMDEEALEKEMLKFWDGEADVLVCTTIIESGLDVPTANTLIVDRSDRLGLAQMYQLRGRVGRSRERAFAYFFFPPQQSLTEEAHERLSTISRFTDLGSGVKIAVRDLEIRGAGNLLGAEQHGHIAAVGFDTYMRLLREAVAQMKGEPVQAELEVRIDLPVRAFIPVGWVGQEGLRLELYRRISNARDHEELDEIAVELRDRFGALPTEVETLFGIARLRVTATRLGITEVATFRKQVRIRPVDIPDRLQLDLQGRVPEATYHASTKTLNLTPDVLGGPSLPGWVEDRLHASVDERADAVGRVP
jgi:transcription-repair coupling factor (superfamily II helicase)